MAEQTIGLTHPFAPIFDERSRVLVLGTFPSVKSRENAFYYGHPQNRFWRVLAGVLNEPAPSTVADKTAMLLRNRIALWDVLAGCDVTGSADSAIKHPIPNDIAGLLGRTAIARVFANGKTAWALYARCCAERTHMEATALPSTSPANAAWSEARLIEAWRAILDIQ